MIVPRFRRAAKAHGLLAEPALVVGVSGGIDSMVLLDLLGDAARGGTPRIAVAHVNYGLRGRCSDADEALVRATAERLGIPCACHHVRLPQRGNIQEAARRARFACFAEVAKEQGARTIVLAHHRGDQAETLLLHLLRGSGLAGLAGMRPAVEYEGMRVVRPLLGCSREEIEAYAERRGIAFREDATNAGTRYTRNAVRHELLPHMAAYNPRIEERLAELAARCAEEDEALEAIAAQGFDDALLSHERDAIVLDADRLVPLPTALRRRLLRRAFQELSGGTAELKADHLQRMEGIACGETGRGRYRLPAPWLFVREGRRLEIRRSDTPCDRPRRR